MSIARDDDVVLPCYEFYPSIDVAQYTIWKEIGLLWYTYSNYQVADMDVKTFVRRDLVKERKKGERSRPIWSGIGK